jgi:hypothetical protein
MRISFDLDDTLILKSIAGPCEETLPARKRGDAIEEKLRKGTRELFLALHEKGWEIVIYSNSFRGKSELISWFSECGLPVCEVINQQLHDQKRAASNTSCPTKFPPWFNIDLHVDDAHAVYQEGRLHGFDVVRVSPRDLNWTSVVLKAADEKQHAESTT